MAPTVADVVACSSRDRRYLLFLLVLIVIFTVQNFCALITYDRHSLLEIGKADLDCLTRVNSVGGRETDRSEGEAREEG